MDCQNYVLVTIGIPNEKNTQLAFTKLIASKYIEKQNCRTKRTHKKKTPKELHLLTGSVNLLRDDDL